MRADSFLWAVRLFKTRSLAAETLQLGRVSIGDQKCKPSKECKPGDCLTIRHHGYIETYTIVAIPPSRVGAPLVSQFIVNTTPEEEMEKKKRAQTARALTRPKGEGRPTKRDRRSLDNLF